MYNLPEKKDFMTGDYTEIIFKQKPAPTKKTLKIVRDYCISIQKAAKKEEREYKRKQKKDLEVKMLEENIKEYFKSYYKNMYKNCTCKLQSDD